MSEFDVEQLGALLSLQRSAPASLRRQVEDGLRNAIRSGRLRPGVLLPSTRTFARELGISRGLVVNAYEQLTAEAYLTPTVGSGTRVADGLGRTDRQAAPVDVVDVQRPAVDFAYGVPDLRSFPARDWLWALSDALRATPVAALGDGPVEGNARLRAVLAEYHRRVRGGRAEAADTVVVGGFRQGLGFTLSALASHGVTRVALEDPGPRDHDEIARRSGLTVAAVPVDDEGVVVDALRAGPARAVLLTPAHQCPTGVVLSPRRRRELVAWARAVDGVIVEDDYDAEFRYDRRPVGSLQGLAPERVIALGSVSKTLAPALRIGWVFAPTRFRSAICHEKYLACREVPYLEQAALARLIESGRFDKHLRTVRRTYCTRRQALMSALAEHLPEARASGPDAGQHVLIRLPAHLKEREFVAAAKAAGVGIRGLQDYRVAVGAGTADPSGPAVVLGFGNLTVDQIREGVRVLAASAAAVATPR